MLNAMRDILSNRANSNNGEDGEDEDDAENHPEPDMLSKDEEPSWVMCIISTMVQHRTERFR